MQALKSVPGLTPVVALAGQSVSVLAGLALVLVNVLPMRDPIQFTPDQSTYRMLAMMLSA